MAGIAAFSCSSSCFLGPLHLVPSGAAGVIDGDGLAAGANVCSRLELKREWNCVDSSEHRGPQIYGNAALVYPPRAIITSTASCKDSRKKEQPPFTQSRREWLFSSAAVLAAIAAPGSAQGLSRLYDVADDDSSAAGTSEAAPPSTSPSNVSKPVQSVDDVTTWYRFRGEGFALRIPPGYQDVLDPQDEEALNSLYGERAKDRPFAARFASPDREEVLSVVIKPASQMQLSFFEALDIKDFGTIREAAPKFVPGGAKLVAAKIINSTKSRIPRTYYLYEFVAKDKHVALSAGVAGGRVFVLGATAPESKWKESGDKLRLAASSFYLP